MLKVLKQLKWKIKNFWYNYNQVKFNTAYQKLQEKVITHYFITGNKVIIETEDAKKYIHKMNKEDYNKESVEYCLNCGSLHIVEEESLSVCNNCGSIDFTGFASINEWLKIRGDQKMD